MILLYCWYLILLDIIENNATFVLPTNSCYAEVRAEPVKGEDFRRAYAAGKFKGIDYFESDFTGYRLAYNFRTRKGSNRRKDIYINQKMKDLFYEKINNGKKYY